MQTLHKKTIIVIGAGGDIGSVLSKQFHNQGANVVLVGRTEATLRVVEQNLGAERVLVVPADATDTQAIKSVFDSAVSAFGSVDGIIISAGSWKQINLDDDIDIASSLSDHHYKTIFLPVFIAGWQAQQFFRNQGHGLIVHMSSHAAVREHLRGNSTYGAMKAAARRFILGLADELKENGIRATDLMIAIVNTAKNQGFLDTEEKRGAAVRPEDIAQWIIDHFDDQDIPSSQLLDSTHIV